MRRVRLIAGVLAAALVASGAAVAGQLAPSDASTAVAAQKPQVTKVRRYDTYQQCTAAKRAYCSSLYPYNTPQWRTCYVPLVVAECEGLPGTP
jgi:hypothetical protein